MKRQNARCSLKGWARQTCLRTTLLETRLGARLMQKGLPAGGCTLGSSCGTVRLAAGWQARVPRREPLSVAPFLPHGGAAPGGLLKLQRARAGRRWVPGGRSSQCRFAVGAPESGGTWPERGARWREAASGDVGERSYGVGFPPCEVLLSGGHPHPRRASVSIVACFKRKERKEAGAAVLSHPNTQARSLQPGRSKSVAFVNKEKPNTVRVLAGMELMDQILKINCSAWLGKVDGSRYWPRALGGAHRRYSWGFVIAVAHNSSI